MRKNGKYIKCKQCENRFYVPKHKLKLYKKHYCNRKCRAEFMKTPQSWTYKGGLPNCIICGKQLSERKYQKCISCAQKKRFKSKKERMKISKGLLGHIPWNKNKHPEYMQGRNHPMFKGRKYDGNGYVMIYLPKHPYAKRGSIREHRFVVEQQISRYLLPEEQCHHLNRIKDDNRPKNLMCFINCSAHKRFEGKGNVKPEEIIFDGRKIANGNHKKI